MFGAATKGILKEKGFEKLGQIISDNLGFSMMLFWPIILEGTSEYHSHRKGRTWGYHTPLEEPSVGRTYLFVRKSCNFALNNAVFRHILQLYQKTIMVYHRNAKPIANFFHKRNFKFKVVKKLRFQKENKTVSFIKRRVLFCK